MKLAKEDNILYLASDVQRQQNRVPVQLSAASGNYDKRDNVNLPYGDSSQHFLFLASIVLSSLSKGQFVRLYVLPLVMWLAQKRGSLARTGDRITALCTESGPELS